MFKWTFKYIDIFILWPARFICIYHIYLFMYKMIPLRNQLYPDLSSKGRHFIYKYF